MYVSSAHTVCSMVQNFSNTEFGVDSILRSIKAKSKWCRSLQVSGYSWWCICNIITFANAALLWKQNKPNQFNWEHLRVSSHFLELSFLKNKEIITSVQLSEGTVKAYISSLKHYIHMWKGHTYKVPYIYTFQDWKQGPILQKESVVAL